MIDENKLIEEIKSLQVVITGVTMTNLIKRYVKEFKDSVIKIIEEQAKVGEWIPCSERMPEEHDSIFKKMERNR